MKDLFEALKEFGKALKKKGNYNSNIKKKDEVLVGLEALNIEALRFFKLVKSLFWRKIKETRKRITFFVSEKKEILTTISILTISKKFIRAPCI